MDWAEDFKLSLKKSAKKGRRANPQQTPTPQNSSEKEESFDIDIDISQDLTESTPKEPPKPKTGGWADSRTKSGKLKSGKGSFEQEFPTSTPIETDHSFDDDIPIIPDLDDIQDELLMNETVEAPSVTINRVDTFKELNSELLKQSAFCALEDIDLSILTTCLKPHAVLEETDEAWDWEALFTEVSVEIHSDKPPQAKVESALPTEDIPLQTQYVN